jgi:polyhydroxybutyrate depolymerase
VARSKTRALIGLLVLAVLLLPACRPSGRRSLPTPGAAALPPGETTRALTHDGRRRSYTVHVPPTYDPDQPTPVVLVFHGGLGNAENAQRMTGFSAKADAEGFVAVYPNGTGRREEKLLTWNGGTCCGYAVAEDVDDVGFVAALLEDLATVVHVDERRIYATGMSNGAIMSYRLACELSERIAAIGPVAATQNVSPCEPRRPVPVIHFHGDSDQHAPYEGGVGPESLADVDFTSVEETIAFWVEHNRCAAQVQGETAEGVRYTLYTACAQRTTVELYVVLGGLHAWPGGVSGWAGGDEPSEAISATDVMWDFFEAHPFP